MADDSSSDESPPQPARAKSPQDAMRLIEYLNVDFLSGAFHIPQARLAFVAKIPQSFRKLGLASLGTLNFNR